MSISFQSHKYSAVVLSIFDFAVIQNSRMIAWMIFNQGSKELTEQSCSFCLTCNHTTDDNIEASVKKKKLTQKTDPTKQMMLLLPHI